MTPRFARSSRRALFAGVGAGSAVALVKNALGQPAERRVQIAAEPDAAATQPASVAILPSVTALRADKSGTALVFIEGFAAAGDGGEGFFYRGDGGKSADNAGTIVVGAAGQIYRRVTEGTPLNVRWFGAKGNGASDDTGAIQAAIAVCEAERGGIVFFPAGNYKIAGTLSIRGENVRLVGTARRGTILNFANGSADCIVVQGSSSRQLYGFQMENLSLRHSGKSGGRSLLLAYAAKAVLRDIEVDQCWTGWEIWVTNDIFVENVVFQDIVGGANVPASMGDHGPGACYAIFWHAPADGSARSDVLTTINTIANGRYSGADGFVWDGMAQTWNMFQTTALDCRYGLHVMNSARSRQYWPAFGEFDNFNTDGMSAAGTLIEGGRTFQFVNCNLCNTSGSANQGGKDRSAVEILADDDASYTSSLWFTNCRIGQSRESALRSAARDLTIVGCVFEAGGTTPDATYAAIEIAAPAQDVVITASKIAEWGAALKWQYGMHVASGTYRIAATGNNFYGAKARAIHWENNNSASLDAINVSGNPDLYNPAPFVVPAGITVQGDVTLPADKLLGGLVIFSGGSAPFAVTTDTAARLVSQVQSPMYGQGIPVLVINASRFAMTLRPGKGVALRGTAVGNTFLIPPESQRHIIVRLENLAAGNEAVAVYG